MDYLFWTLIALGVFIVVPGLVVLITFCFFKASDSKDFWFWMWLFK